MSNLAQQAKESFPFMSKTSDHEISLQLINFCEKMGALFEMKDFLLTLKAHIPKKFKVGELLLFYESEIFGSRRAYIRNGRFYEDEAKKIWPTVQNISFSDNEHSLYLADEMGRPFSKTLMLPLPTEDSSKAGDSKSALLFVEIGHWKNNKESLTEFFKTRHLVLNLIFQRILWNTKSNRVSYLWSQLFTHWGEPLAILQNFHPLRTNTCFKKSFSSSTPFFLKEKKLSGFIEAEGKSYQLHYYPISQEKNIKTTGVLYCQDMTKHFQLKEQLFQSKKMADLCELGKDMSHQLNNPLTGLRSMTQILYQNPDMKDFKEELWEMEKSLKRSQEIIKNLMSFTQIHGEETNCDLNQAVKNSLLLLKSMTKDFIIKLNLYNEPLEVKGELSVLQQVAYNLILNSCQALQEKQEKRDAFIQIQTKKVSKNTACLKVIDNGPGIAKKNLEKIFQALWTSKKKNKGTGLGLGIARQFVRKFGGNIFVSSQKYQQTCFTVLLPLKDSERGKRREADSILF